MSYQAQKFTEIADAIRYKSGNIDDIVATDFAQEIRKIGTVEHTFDFVPAYVCENTVGIAPDSVEIYGKSVQDGTPTPENPVEIQSVGGDMVVQGPNLAIPQAITIPMLYGIGNVRDVLHIDHGEQRAWIERNTTTFSEWADYSCSVWTAYSNETVTTGFFSGTSFGVVGSPTFSSPGLCDLFLQKNMVTVIDNDTAFYLVPSSSPPYVAFRTKNSDSGINVSDSLSEKITKFKGYIVEIAPTVICGSATPTIEELDYNDFKFLTAENATTITVDGVATEIKLTTYVSSEPPDSSSYQAVVLRQLGIAPTETIEEQNEQLEALGVDIYD